MNAPGVPSAATSRARTSRPFGKKPTPRIPTHGAVIAGRRFVSLVSGASVALLVLLGGSFTAPVAAQGVTGVQSGTGPAAYGSTLTFGTGLVSIPVAWVSPGSGDLFAAFSARAIGEGAIEPGVTRSPWDLTGSLEAHLGGKVAVGAALYGTRRQQMGAFARVMVVQQPAANTTGPRWRPSIAIGVRNLGSSKYQDRFVTGDRRAVDLVGGVRTDSAGRTGRGVFNGSPTLYAVATRDFAFTRSSASFSVGYGNGLFKETGGLDSVYNRAGTIAKGLFLGGRLVVPSGDDGIFSFMLENNGFDWNGGVSLTLGHLAAGVYMTEMEETNGIPDDKPLANFRKTAVSFSYNASLPGIIAGSTRRAEAAEAQVALRRLEQEIAQRRLITSRLVAELNKAAKAADAATASERNALLRQIEAERAALKSAAERLDQLQKKPPEKAP